MVHPYNENLCSYEKKSRNPLSTDMGQSQKYVKWKRQVEEQCALQSMIYEKYLQKDI